MLGRSLLSLLLLPFAPVLAPTDWHDRVGTGGPGGNFNWQIGTDFGGPPVTFVLDTTYAVISNDTQTATETVINGRVEVRNFTLKPNGVLLLQGPNPCSITATGEIRIEGAILAKGVNHPSVQTLNTTNIPEPGAAGGPGGGRGGTSSWRVGSSTEVGGSGFGAFNRVDRGGSGGESGYNPLWPTDLDEEHRRPGGGGGGTFGHDFLRPAHIAPGYTNPNDCADQLVIGLDVESGFPGYPGALGAVSGVAPPAGGTPGPRPFTDSNRRNDFWGTMSTASGEIIGGELQHPWAGAGGGAGGNAIVSNSFPTTPFDPTGDEKGAGGGGGGGSLTILAAGPIIFGESGRIVASGGTGGGGENSLSGGVTHIGGGSGGGSGGHVILQSFSRIDFSLCRTTSNPPGGIYALGGQGGAGKDNLGGSMPGGLQTLPQLDALPQNSYPNTTATCGVVAGQAGYPFSNVVGNQDPQSVVICAGGDGGPGIVQLHVPSPEGIVPPATPGESIYAMIKPPPVSSLPGSGVPSYERINRPMQWNRMVPHLGSWPDAQGVRAPSVPDSDPLHFPIRF